ncbi:hypothetical protein KIN20_029953 [Parelaphostrongylus tenuis]|uniref:Uncharacterized protein n=1 Tax=Parelaphostrongylus tenuis TaxID=148309 RepID=A0AAD5R3Z4_PARTN|nr:hypothetical protein KIN20_029953 [Parelaphostrongylus tenuis]
MKVLTNMATLSTLAFVVLLLTIISTVLGCGMMPAIQARSRPFTVTGFTTLPVAMVYSTAADVQSQVPGIAFSKEGAQGFVQRLVMQTVFDVLESQGRSALLPDAVISSILSQLDVKITYEAMQCQNFVRNPTTDMVEDMKDKCIIVGNTVMGVCTKMMMMKNCMDVDVKITPVPASHTSVKGTLTTTNIIMANWSRTMWQNVLNRAIRMLALSSFGSHFFSATGSVGGS